MKIERIDDKTVKCFISTEELEEYELDYKDFVTQSDKAKEVVQEIMMQAHEEVGYTPPKFAFDLQIMMIPNQGLLLTFSEKSPLETGDGAKLLECLKEMKRVLTENKEALPEKIKKIASEAEDKTGAAQKKETQVKKPETAVFAFRNLGRVLEFAAMLPANLRVQSVLYRMEEVYYLYLNKGKASYERYSRVCIQAMEFGALFAADDEKMRYLEEHGECIIAQKALKKLRLGKA